MSKALLGGVGSILAMVGVIACPITSGDTAFRSARLTIADWFKIDQQDKKKRLLLSLPLLLVGYGISKLDYGVIWRYFSWSNQTLAMMVLWAIAVYLCRYRSKISSWMASIPATYMTAVTIAYILQAKEGFRIDEMIHKFFNIYIVDIIGISLANIIGIWIAAVVFAFYMIKVYIKAGDTPLVDTPLEVK